jgi:hypothetical protein
VEKAEKRIMKHGGINLPNFRLFHVTLNFKVLCTWMRILRTEIV